MTSHKKIHNYLAAVTFTLGALLVGFSFLSINESLSKEWQLAQAPVDFDYTQSPGMTPHTQDMAPPPRPENLNTTPTPAPDTSSPQDTAPAEGDEATEAKAIEEEAQEEEGDVQEVCQSTPEDEGRRTCCEERMVELRDAYQENYSRVLTTEGMERRMHDMRAYCGIAPPEDSDTQAQTAENNRNFTSCQSAGYSGQEARDCAFEGGPEAWEQFKNSPSMIPESATGDGVPSMNLAELYGEGECFDNDCQFEGTDISTTPLDTRTDLEDLQSEESIGGAPSQTEQEIVPGNLPTPEQEATRQCLERAGTNRDLRNQCFNATCVNDSNAQSGRICSGAPDASLVAPQRPQDLDTSVGCGATMRYSLAGKDRKDPPNQDVRDGIRCLTTEVLGHCGMFEMTSGKGTTGRDSVRHHNGHAADGFFTRCDGSIVTIYDPEMRELMLTAPYYGFTGWGMGEEYMGSTVVHIDNFPPERYTGNMGHFWRSAAEPHGQQFVRNINDAKNSTREIRTMARGGTVTGPPVDDYAVLIAQGDDTVFAGTPSANQPTISTGGSFQTPTTPPAAGVQQPPRTGTTQPTPQVQPPTTGGGSQTFQPPTGGQQTPSSGVGSGMPSQGGGQGGGQTQSTGQQDGGNFLTNAFGGIGDLFSGLLNSFTSLFSGSSDEDTTVTLPTMPDDVEDGSLGDVEMSIIMFIHYNNERTIVPRAAPVLVRKEDEVSVSWQTLRAEQCIVDIDGRVVSETANGESDVLDFSDKESGDEIVTQITCFDANNSVLNQEMTLLIE